MKRQIFVRILSIVLAFMLVFSTVYAENQILDSGTTTSKQQTEGSTPGGDETPGGDNPTDEEENEDTSDEPADQITYAQLMTNIADIYASQNTLGEWEAFDMASYNAYMSAKGETEYALLSDTAKQNYVNLTVTALNGTGVYASERAKGEIILKALGYDSTKLYPVNSSAPVNNATLLRNETYLGDYRTAVWLLLANLQGKLNLPDEKITAALDMIEQSLDGGVFAFSWDGFSFPDPDTTGWAVAALTGLMGKAQFAERANTLSQTMLTGLSNSLGQNGSYGNVNSDAMIITGLLAAGIDPYTDTRFVKEGGSLCDALKLYINEANNGFVSAYPGGEALATEQGFRALVALERFKWQNASYNIYAPNTINLVPAYAVGSGTTSVPSAPPAESNDITVTFEMVGYKSTWIANKSTTVKEDSKVYHLLKKMFEEKNMTADGIEQGYIKSVTYNGSTLGQFDKGVNSGWLYYVNGNLPNVGISDYTLNDGDAVRFVYTTDYVEIWGAVNVSKPSSSGGAGGDKKEEKEETDKDEKAEVIPSAGFTDIETDAPYTKAVDFMYAKGIMEGTGDKVFSPKTPLSRAMLVTILHRLDGEPKTDGESEFGDLTEDWYKDAVAWANENGIVKGTDVGVFSPDDMIIGEHLNLIIDRYCDYKSVKPQKKDESLRVLEENKSEFGNEWSALLLARSGGYDEWTDGYYKNIESYVKECGGVLDDRKYTEYSRLILALTAMGKDVTNVRGYDMLYPLGDYEKTVYQGINGAIWALIALDSGNYDIPVNAEATTQATRDMYVTALIENEVSGGGWALSGDEADADVTAMALVALAKYSADEEVASAIERALDKMSSVQNKSGGFSAWGVENAESAAQMLIALSTLGISVDDERFVKKGNTILDNLETFKTKNGYEHVKGGGVNMFATEQCLSAIEAYERFENGKNSLYDMSDKVFVSGIENNPADEVLRAQVAMVFYDLYGVIQ